MKAVLMTAYGEAGVLQYRTVETPEPGPGQVRVKILAAGVNRYDIYLRLGVIHQQHRLPHILGSDWAGVVDKTGAGVSGFQPGDSVMALPGFALDPAEQTLPVLTNASSFSIVGARTDGAYAEYLLLPQHALMRNPTALSAAQFATLPMPLTTAVHAVRQQGAVQAGQTVLVHSGNSATGFMAIQVAKALGASVATTVRGKQNADVAAMAGADLIIDTLTGNTTAQLQRWSPSQRLDTVIDNLGGDTLSDSLALLRPQGVLVSLGFVLDSYSRIPLKTLFSRQLQIRGSVLGNADDLCWGLQLLQQGKLQLRPIQSQPLSAAHLAHTALETTANVAAQVLIPAH